jgi:hypothetical protein
MSGDGPQRARFESETVLPSQYLDRVVAAPSLQPEKRLMLAVLESAVATYQKHALATSRRGQRLFRETEQWLGEPGDGWLFSFENICNALLLDPGFIRSGLSRWRDRERGRGSVRSLRFPFRRVNARRHSVSGRPAGLRTAW